MRLIFFVLSFFLPILAHSELVAVYDTKLHIEKIGRGTPIIVVNGGPGFDHTYLRPHLDPLAIRNRVIYYDQRNLGLSDDSAKAETITIGQYVDDIEGLRQTLGFDRVIILGHSWGAFLSMQYAAKYPARVSALILVDTLPASSLGMQAFIAEVTKRLEPHKDVMSRIVESSAYKEGKSATVEGYLRLVCAAYCSNPANTKKLHLAFTPESNLKGAKVRSQMHHSLFVEAYDFHNDLEKISAPTLILHGADDPIPKNEVRRIEQVIPNAQYYEIANSGHYPFVEQEDEFFERITTFLTNLELAGNRE